MRPIMTEVIFRVDATMAFAKDHEDQFIQAVERTPRGYPLRGRDAAIAFNEFYRVCGDPNRATINDFAIWLRKGSKPLLEDKPVEQKSNEISIDDDDLRQRAMQERRNRIELAKREAIQREQRNVGEKEISPEDDGTAPSDPSDPSEASTDPNEFDETWGN